LQDSISEIEVKRCAGLLILAALPGGLGPQCTERHAVELTKRFQSSGIVCDLRSSLRIANWAYTQTFDCQGLTRLRGDELVPLQPGWNTTVPISMKSLALMIGTVRLPLREPF
jgi:hypothetical protein